MTKTVAEAIKEQQERERQNVATEKVAQEKAVEDRTKRQAEAKSGQAEAESAFATKVLDEWERRVKAAAKEDYVHCAVLGTMILHRSGLPHYMNRVEQAVTQEPGCKLELVRRDSIMPTGQSIEPAARWKGHLLAQIRQVGELPRVEDPGGGTQYDLIVRWGPPDTDAAKA